MKKATIKPATKTVAKPVSPKQPEQTLDGAMLQIGLSFDNLKMLVNQLIAGLAQTNKQLGEQLKGKQK